MPPETPFRARFYNVRPWRNPADPILWCPHVRTWGWSRGTWPGSNTPAYALDPRIAPPIQDHIGEIQRSGHIGVRARYRMKSDRNQRPQVVVMITGNVSLSRPPCCRGGGGRGAGNCPDPGSGDPLSMRISTQSQIRKISPEEQDDAVKRYSGTDQKCIRSNAREGIRTLEHLRDKALNLAPLTWLGNPRPKMRDRNLCVPAVSIGWYF